MRLEAVEDARSPAENASQILDFDVNLAGKVLHFDDFS